MLEQSKNIFIVGIKGVAMANLALILKKMGKNVSGSDLAEEFITDQLVKKNGVNISIGFESKLITKDIDLVVYSAAHGGKKNPQIATAEALGIKTIHQAELLGELIKQYKTSIAICGCHGKTTTSSLLAYALIKLEAKPSYMIGSSNFNNYPGGDHNGRDYFVIEADEYGVNPPQDLTPKFHFLNPSYVICTNIDFDHPDVYKNLVEVKNAYLKFFKKLRPFSSIEEKNRIFPLIFCADDEKLMDVAKKIPKGFYLTFGFNKVADLKILNPGYHEFGSDFGLIWNKKVLGKFKISLFGEKNVSNAAGVILTLLQMGFKADDIRKAIKGFTGARRRFELIYQHNNTFLFDDYAHHPKEIETTILAARNRFPGKKIVVVFQPHTYSRTQLLLPDFAKSLSLADHAYIMPIFPSARENSALFSVTSEDIEKQSKKKNITAVSDKYSLFQLLGSHLAPNDMVLTMGAGDIYKLSDGIIKIINSI